MVKHHWTPLLSDPEPLYAKQNYFVRQNGRYARHESLTTLPTATEKTDGYFKTVIHLSVFYVAFKFR